MKPFGEISIDACFIFNAELFKRIADDEQDGQQYNARDIIHGDVWLFSDDDMVEIVA